jgi:hypothetical protein
MSLIHHDTTGTQTDCPKPLSRKKLRQLMPHNSRNLTTMALTDRENPIRMLGRKTGWKMWSNLTRKRQERKTKRKLFERKTLPDGTEFQLMPNAADLVEIKPTIFERLGGIFGNLRRQFERQKAKGK